MNREEIPRYIKNSPPGSVIILDAPSGYGKTNALHEAKNLIGKSVAILSYEEVVNDIVRYLQNDNSGADVTDIIPSLAKKCRVFAIEDIDFLEGKEATQKCICDIINKLADYKTTVIVLTGTDIRQKIPKLVQNIHNVTYIKKLNSTQKDHL